MTIAETTPAKSDIMGLVPWFGSKRTMARDIAIELGEHDGYFELFAGSCAVLLEKSKSLAETVNDYHGDLVNLARVLASDQWEWLYNKADRYLYCEPLFLDLRQRWISEPIPAWEGKASEAHAERAFVYLATQWLGRNGSSGCSPNSSGRAAVRWTTKGGNSATRWRSVVSSIPWWHERLFRVSILNRNAFDVAESISNENGAAVYADPPYFLKTRSSGGGSVYLHDFDETPIGEDEASRIGCPEHLRRYGDHARLAVRLWRLNLCRVVVSYYDHPALSELYPGWTKRSMDRTKNLSLATIKGSRGATAPEVLLINGPSAVRTRKLFE